MKESDERARADDIERTLAGKASWGLPAATVAGAIGVGIVFGVGPAILVLAAGALVGVIALLWASLRTLGGDAPLAEGTRTFELVRPPGSNLVFGPGIGDLAEKHLNHRGVVDVLSGHLDGNDLAAIGIDADMQFAP